MGNRASSNLCYGMIFEEGFEFPWTDEDGNSDLDKWWLKVNGYKEINKLFGDDGEWLPEYDNGLKHWENPTTTEQIKITELRNRLSDENYAAERDFKEKLSLCPVVEIWSGSGDAYEVVLSFNGWGVHGDWDEPQSVDDFILRSYESGEMTSVICQFLEKYDIEHGDKLCGVYLCSLWF